MVKSHGGPRLGEEEAGERSEQVGSGDGTRGWVRTPGAAGRGSGLPGPLTVIAAERDSTARAGAVSGAEWDQAQESGVGCPASVLRQRRRQRRGAAKARGPWWAGLGSAAPTGRGRV